MKTKIAIGTPCFGGNVTSVYMASVIKAMNQCGQRGVESYVNLLSGDALITRARAQITADFLDDAAATHLLFIDADISFEPAQLMRLLDFDKDMVAAIYPVKNIFWNRIPDHMAKGEPINEAGLIYTTQHCTGADLKIEQDFATAEYAATGFLLIKRRAIERMIAAYPETKYSHPDTPGTQQTTAKNYYALYECVIDKETGRYLSEDYAFCRRWRQIGGEIWIDLKSQLTHTGPSAFKGDADKRYAPLINSVRK